MIKQIGLACLLISTICGSNLHAQHIDGGSWIGAGIEFKPIKDFSVNLNEEIRYNISIGSLYQLNSNVSVDYKINKQIKTGIEYRYSIRDGRNTNRFGLSASIKDGFGDFDLGLRSKIQYSPVPDGPEGSAWRNKASLSYKINKHFYPFVSGELFYTFSNTINQFDNYRLEAGIDHHINKHNDLGISWIFDKEFNVNNPGTMHVLTLGYKYSF